MSRLMLVLPRAALVLFKAGRLTQELERPLKL
jgi:hypothetical protein